MMTFQLFEILKLFLAVDNQCHIFCKAAVDAVYYSSLLSERHQTAGGKVLTNQESAEKKRMHECVNCNV